MTEHTMPQKLNAFEKLLNIMDELRVKCPWDKEQTWESLRTLSIEETYELADAVLNGNMSQIKKELGDVLLHIVFYARIASETNDFDIADVIDSLCEKLIYRHPHVFGEVQVSGSGEVIQNWEQLKLKEKDGNKSVLEGIPVSLPALVKAYRIQDKARGVGFDWQEKEQVWEKVTEELNELKAEIHRLNAQKMEEELGDLLFSVVNAARLYDINPENALEKANKKFISRFNFIEESVKQEGRLLKSLSLEEMDVIWNKAKATGL